MRSQHKLALAGILAASLTLASAGAALAHALLVKAVPPVGGRVASSPSEIRITYSETVEPRFSGIELKGADGRSIATGGPSLDPKDHATLVVPLKGALQPGSYKVSWHAVSVDTHRTQGSFSFEVRP